MPAIAVPDVFVPSSNISQLRESQTIAVAARAAALRAAGEAVLDLGAGQPDFDTPAFIRRAAAEAVEAGATRYTATGGILPLRQAIAAEATARAREGLTFTAEQVVVANGAKQALFNVCFALFGEGDEVLVPIPGWTSYAEIVALGRATAVEVPGDPGDGYKVGPAALAAAATSRTRGLILNSPTNPTGSVYSADELRALLALASERGWWVLSDEIYRQISYEAPAPSVLEVAEDVSRLVLIDGVSKAYAMTGWRIGWSISPAPLARAATALQSHVTYNAAAVSQHAALAALTNTGEAARAVTTMVRAFRERRDAALAVVAEEPLLRVIAPAGAFYLFVDVSAWAPADPEAGTRFAERLLEESRVAVVPGAAFGTPGWVRVSYAAPLADVVEGMRRIVALARQRAS